MATTSASLTTQLQAQLVEQQRLLVELQTRFASTGAAAEPATVELYSKATVALNEQILNTQNQLVEVTANNKPPGVNAAANPETPQLVESTLSAKNIDVSATSPLAQNEYGDYYIPLPVVSDVNTSADAIHNAAVAGLTPAQLTALGGADPTDPYIRARLDLPPLTVTPNLVSSVSDYFKESAAPVPASEVDVSATPTNYGTTTQTFDDGTTIQTFDDGSTLATGTDGGLSSSPAPVGPVDPVAESYYNQLVNAFSSPATTQDTAPSPYAPVAATTDIPLVAAGTVSVEAAPAGFDNADPIPIIPYSSPELVTSAADNGFVEQADGSFIAVADAAPVDDTADGAFVQQADGSFVAVADAAPVDIDGNAFAAPETALTDINGVPAPVADPYAAQDIENGANAGTGTSNTGERTSAALSSGAAAIAAGTNLARQAKEIAIQRGQQQNADWRVRLQLAAGADYLYRAADPGILQPLVATDGIIFPYTPKIDMIYKANYSSYDLTHSNFRGYFYQNSAPGDITINAHFTAQDTNQANYLLAVIHFFRSVTKMFYGQDAQRGTPPPLVFLTGLGQYQFNNHPCLVQTFNYSLPEDVDYIRAQTANKNGNLNLTSANSVKQSVATNTIFASVQRLAAAFTTKGALKQVPFGNNSAPNLAQGSPTYVPTKMDIAITLLPVNTRQQVSQQFKLQEFAKGNQLKGGFW